MSAATLLLEVALTRILSVSLWYHFAFMGICTALFGLGFAGLALAFRRSHDVPARLLARIACGTPIAFVLGYAVYNWIPFEPFSLGSQSAQWLYLPIAYLALTVPFFFSGMTIAALLTRHAAQVHRLYLVDLVGAGMGAVAIVWLLPALGGSGTVLVSATLAAGGAAFLAAEHSRRWAIASAILATLLATLIPFAEQLVPVRISDNKKFGEAIADEKRNMFTGWNTISRIDVIQHGDHAGNEQRTILIDAGTALTRVARPEAPIEQLEPTAD